MESLVSGSEAPTNSPPRAFLNAALGAYSGEIAMTVDDVPTPAEAAVEAAEAGGTVMLASVVQGGSVAFLVRRADDAEPDAWTSYKLTPTAALYSEAEHVLLAVWALDHPAERAEVQALADALGCDLDAPVPLPGCDGWRLLDGADPDRFYSVADLAGAYLGGDAEPPSAGEATAGCVIVPPDDDPDWRPETDPRLGRTLTITVGGRDGRGVKSRDWTERDYTIGNHFTALITPQIGRKDGTGYMVGRHVSKDRNAAAMVELYGFTFDHDDGTPISRIVEAYRLANILCAIHTTASHMKTLLEYSKKRVNEYAAGRKFDDALIQSFMLNEGKYTEEICRSASYLGVEHGKKGIMVQVRTVPIPRCRAFVPFARPVVVEALGDDVQTASAKWKAMMLSFVEKLNREAA